MSVCVHICVKLLFPRLVLGISGSHSVSSSLNGVKLSHVEKRGFSYNTAPHPPAPSHAHSEKEQSLPTPGRETSSLGSGGERQGCPGSVGLIGFSGNLGSAGLLPAC